MKDEVRQMDIGDCRVALATEKFGNMRAVCENF